MSAFLRFCKRLPLFALCGGISLAIGLIVPTVFQWSKEGAWRTRGTVIERAALVVFVLTLLSSAVIWWLRKPQDEQAVVLKSPQLLQFGLRELFVATTVAAVLLFLAPLLKPPLAPGLVTVVVVGIGVWSCFHSWPVRSRVGALLASMFLPFAWMVAYNVPFGRTSGLSASIPLGPAMLPAAFVRRFVDSVNVDRAGSVAAVLVVLQLILGAWLAKRGGAMSVAYIILALLLSSLTSLVMHALYRM